MPRYYFHLHNDVDAPDREGIDFLDLSAARQHAGKQARFTAGQTVMETGRINLQHHIDIEDDQGDVLGRVSFGDVVAVSS